MTQPLSPEAAVILERLRQQNAHFETQATPPEVERVPVAPEEPSVDDLAPLRAEVETALAGHRDVGQINPRRPGLHNRVIQFVKKVMRRSLSWYTRPIHVFQSAVIRALQNIVSLLQGQQEFSGRLAQELSSVSERVTEVANDTRRQFTREVAGFRTEIMEKAARSSADLSGQIVRIKSDLFDHVSRSNGELSREMVRSKADILTQVSQTNGELSREMARSKADILTQVSQTNSEFSREMVRSNADILTQVSQMNGELSREMARSKADILTQVSQANGELSGQIDGIRSSTLQLRSVVDSLHEELRNGRNHLLAVIRDQRARERDVRRFVNAVETGIVPLSLGPAKPTPPMFASEIKCQDEFDYFLFEDTYRGDETVIRNRQAEYLKYFLGRENVVDIGCGRGEFLELLRDNGIAARGVELGIDQFLLCREKGLDVVQQDLLTFLESVPDESLGGLFSAQVIEHLTASDQLRYVALAYRKSKPGSPVIFETINAQCVFAVVRNFFLDPTHVRPVHPETLKFAMESVNFRDVELQFMAPVEGLHIPALNIGGNAEEMERFNAAIRQLNDLIYGCQDYAAIGWR
jgi:SAM-dependent methyltransferase